MAKFTEEKEFFKKLIETRRPILGSFFEKLIHKRTSAEEQVKVQAKENGIVDFPVEPAKIQKEPKILITGQAVNKMIRGTELRPHTETGEALIGLVIKPNSPEILEPTIYILDTIPPDESAVREWAYFESGDERQRQIFIWLSRNWEEMRRIGLVPQEFNQPLRHIGNWHKHPEMLKVPSGGDLQTAEDMIKEGMNQIVVPVTTRKAVKEERLWWEDEEKLLLKGGLDNITTISFSYLSKNMLERGEKYFMRVKPVFIADGLAPKLPQVSWHLENPKRYELEVNLLRGHGCRVGLLIREMTGAPPMEIALTAQKQGWRNRLLFITNADYPDSAPVIKIFDPAGIEEKSPKNWLSAGLEKVQEIFAPAVEPDKPPEKLLIEYVWQLEREGKL